MTGEMRHEGEGWVKGCCCQLTTAGSWRSSLLGFPGQAKSTHLPVLSPGGQGGWCLQTPALVWLGFWERLIPWHYT